MTYCGAMQVALGEHLKGLLSSLLREGKLILVTRNLYLSVFSTNLLEDEALLQEHIRPKQQSKTATLQVTEDKSGHG